MGRPRGYDRHDAVRAAKRLFWKRGYVGTSVGDLVEATGMPRRSLYTEFGSKDGLFTEALRLYIREEGSVYAHHLGGSHKGWSAVLGYFEAMEFASDFRGCFLVNSLAEREVLPTAAVALLDRFFAGVRRLFEETIEAARHAGELRSDTDPATLAAALVSFDSGLAIVGKHPEIREELSHAIKTFLVTIRGRAGERDTTRHETHPTN